jgi:hypothetical protein
MTTPLTDSTARIDLYEKSAAQPATASLRVELS